jgi:hypothetical protein
MTSAAAGGALTDAVPPSSGVVAGGGWADGDTGDGGRGELARVVDWVLVCERDGVVAGCVEGRIEGDDVGGVTLGAGWVSCGAGSIGCAAAGGVGFSTRDGVGSMDAALQSRNSPADNAVVTHAHLTTTEYCRLFPVIDAVVANSAMN